MARDKINTLTDSLSGFFGNNSESLYDYNKQRETYMYQEAMYAKSEKHFRAVCLSFHELNTPGLGLPTAPPPNNSAPSSSAGEGAGGGGTSTTGGTKTIASSITTGIQGSVPEVQLAQQTVTKVEKMTIKIRFIGEDHPRNGYLTEDPLGPNITGAKRTTLISLHPSATVMDLGVIPNHQDIMIVRQDQDGKYYVEKIIGNMMGIIPMSTPGAAGIAKYMQQSGQSLGGFQQQPTSLGENQAMHYKEANRTAKDISLIVLHSTAGATGSGKAQACINFFGPPIGPTWSFTDPTTKKENPPCSDYPDGVLPPGRDGKETVCHPTKKKVYTKVYSSIHYATDQGGNGVQGVLDKDIAYHAGKGGLSGRSIGIEMCGVPGVGPGQGAGGKYSKMYNDLMLEATAKLCARLCRDYQIPVQWVQSNREAGIIGHDQFAPKNRSDPGWILNKHENSKKKKGRWHLSKNKDGTPKYPEGNYWDWADFINRIRRYYNPPQKAPDFDGDGIPDAIDPDPKTPQSKKATKSSSDKKKFDFEEATGIEKPPGESSS